MRAFLVEEGDSMKVASTIEPPGEPGEPGLLQPVVRQDAPELEQRGGVGHLLAHEVDSDEALHGARVEHGVLAALVGQVEPALQQVHAQHLLEVARRPAAPAGLVVERPYQRRPLRPGHDRVHLLEEGGPPRGPPLPGELEVAERGLLRHAQPPYTRFRDGSMIQERAGHMPNASVTGLHGRRGWLRGRSPLKR